MAHEFGKDGFRVDRLAFSGVPGALVALCCLAIVRGIPSRRWLAFLALGTGAVFGVVLAYVRRRWLLRRSSAV